ncbi:MAG: YcgN family cysteine cluster protein [Desulfobacteraceae bacterium]|nr:MAG: YcgN family cysteine cluster protein [Desulfobacteraceae bacterium]
MKPFWLDKNLAQLTPAQWEALCDGCGRCCLEKLKNAKTGKVQYTWVACYLLDIETCRCTDYSLRHLLVPDCIELRPDTIARLGWMPRTCAYRLVAENKALPAWHPLVSGDPNSVHSSGISVRNRAISEQLVHPDDLNRYLIKERL